MKEFTSIQLFNSYILASYYKHAWACVNKWKDIENLSIKEISALTEKIMRDCHDPGITSPTVVDGVIVHTTGTGRLTWEIYEDGSYIFRVFRPDCPEGEYDPCGKYESIEVLRYNSLQGKIERVNSKKPIGKRHIVAIAEAIAVFETDKLYYPMQIICSLFEQNPELASELAPEE